MKYDDLVDIEARLRDLLTAAGLAWILADVDQAINDGVVAPKRLEQRRRGPSTPDRALAKTRKNELFLTSRPMSASERVLTFLEALTRFAVDVPAAAYSSVDRLSALASTHDLESETVTQAPTKSLEGEPGHAPPVGRIVFQPEPDAAGDIEVAVDRESSQRAIQAGAEIRDVIAHLVQRVRT